MQSINGKITTKDCFSLDNLQNKSLKCLFQHMKDITFEHLSTCWWNYLISHLLLSDFSPNTF